MRGWHMSKALILAAVGCITWTLLVAAQPSQNGLFIRPDRPWVDISFDRYGPRQPVLPGESSTGFWLKLRNNCIYTIKVLLTPDTKGNVFVLNKDADSLIYYEVREVSRSGVPPPPSGTPAEDVPELAPGAILPQD